MPRLCQIFDLECLPGIRCRTPPRNSKRKRGLSPIGFTLSMASTVCELKRPGFSGYRLVCVLRSDRHRLKLGMVCDFCFSGRDVAYRLDQPAVVSRQSGGRRGR